jgi:paraquat-inducible protein B
MARKFNPRLVGGFVLGAIALGTAAAVYLGGAQIFQHKVRFVVVFAQDLAGLDVDAPVKFRGVPVGRVASIYLSIGSPKEPLRELFMPVVIELNTSRIQEMGGKTDLADPAIVKTLIDHGLRARLALESFLSLRRYVDLDIVPDAPVPAPPPGPFPYQVIPVYVEPGLSALQADVSKLVLKLQALDLEGLVADLRGAAVGVGRAAATLERTGESLAGAIRTTDQALVAVRDAARTLESQVPPVAADARLALQGLARSLERIEEAMREVKQSLDPSAPAPVRLDEMLREVTQAARSVRLLADSIERNPGELLRGRSQAKP